MKGVYGGPVVLASRAITRRRFTAPWLGGNGPPMPLRTCFAIIAPSGAERALESVARQCPREMSISGVGGHSFCWES